jgi:hypothetical protein
MTTGRDLQKRSASWISRAQLVGCVSETAQKLLQCRKPRKDAILYNRNENDLDMFQHLEMTLRVSNLDVNSRHALRATSPHVCLTFSSYVGPHYVNLRQYYDWLVKQDCARECVVSNVQLEARQKIISTRTSPVVTHLSTTLA